ncbi:hypothetical protein NLJ89_g4427 [Agrocybe chaxingu]|uniref:Uncharacterized protein n=1 Tax=Agrocybe chaxingu TaxID=84603 RepID=A0A9W8K2Y3_9AGAR|nr:hypothetical protein NLJ89_g4427 [Agrocybe chaxingu]
MEVACMRDKDEERRDVMGGWRDGGRENASSKPRGRLARSAALKKPEAIEIEDEDEDEEMPEAFTSLKDTQELADETEPPQDTPLTRNLVPKAQFSSFTLWHADRPVEKTRDEYFRTLEEWIALSHEVGFIFLFFIEQT